MAQQNEKEEFKSGEKEMTFTGSNYRHDASSIDGQESADEGSAQIIDTCRKEQPRLASKRNRQQTKKDHETIFNAKPELKRKRQDRVIPIKIIPRNPLQENDIQALWFHINVGDNDLRLIENLFNKMIEINAYELGEILMAKQFSDSSKSNPQKGQTLLHFCISKKDPSFRSQYLYGHKSNERSSILDLVAETFKEILKRNQITELKLKSFVNQTDYFGNSPIIEAAKHNNEKALAILIDKLGVNKDGVNFMKHSAMTVASMNGHLNIVKMLYSRGVNVLTENVDGKNAMEQAELLKKEDTVQYLNPIVFEAKQWKSKNCLVKLMINRRKAKKINNITEGIFREIIKYAGVQNENDEN